ncbi:hypothetical protein [Arthrobacter sp. QXT-31]|uniref:hypothetical protein n=1 Tax=Arthrobacter sp. QXT-31 TaxID=1357915 RepID=UPI0012FBBB65|nr:hypothetical protein [Arthrobacter sp. QXT-31]
MTPGVTPERRVIGQGLPLPKAFFVTNWNADTNGVPDLIVQDQAGIEDGVLTYREGLTTGGFTDHRIGNGWLNHDITVGKWKKTDKYPSIIARNNITGDLFHYANPSGKNLSAPVKIGTGWKGLSFNLLDWDKDGNTDVIAKNSSGQLKLFRTNGAGSFISENRATIGSGWNTLDSIHAVEGLHGSGTVGLRARDWAGVLHYYPANKSTWGPRETYTGGWNPHIIAGTQITDTSRTHWDYSISSTSSVAAYDPEGGLWSYAWMTPGVTPEARAIGPAGAPIPKAFFVTNWNADTNGVPDMIVQDQAGTLGGDGILTYREGLTTGEFTDHRIGNGWLNYDITVGKWKKTDKYPSIIARNNITGDLFHYANASGKGLSAPVKIGTGWKGLSFNLLDWDKDGNTDVIAKNSSGQLKLFRTNGAGSFISENRTIIGSGWNTMDSIHAVSGLHGSGTVGLRARDSAGVLHYYPANKSAWGPRETYTGGWSNHIIAGN